MSVVFSYAQNLSHRLFEKELLTSFVKSYLFAGITLCCDFFSLWNYWQGLESDCISSWSLLFSILLWYCSGYSFNIMIDLVLLFQAYWHSFMLCLFTFFPFIFAASCCLEQYKMKQKGKIFHKVKPQCFVLLRQKSG